jgi:hypothetical protein
MEYRNIEYQVVQTSSPTGWKWTVHIPGRRVRTGSSYNRASAIGLAHRAIDKLLMSETNTIALSAVSKDGPSSVEGP